MNKNIDDVYKSIIDLLNQSGLPIGVGVLILKDIYNDLNNLYKQAILEEGNTAVQEEEQKVDLESLPTEGEIIE
jgi:hypothetical protein